MTLPMNLAWWIIDQLIQQGVTQFCVSPGSRSTPLVHAAAHHPKAKTTVHFDERGIAFFALGIGKATGSPAAVITTSGTAVGNLMPATMEAYHSRIPLLLLTADRPHELRDCGANQTTDQVKFFPNVTRWSMDLTSSFDEKMARSIAAQAYFHATSRPQGPIQLNCPFQEPLYAPPHPLPKGDPMPQSHPKLVAPPLKVEAKRGVILLGPVQNPTAVLKLAAELRWPVFADLLSNGRTSPTPEQIRYFDYLIRAPSDLKPDLILHFGGRFVSKHILDWEKEAPFIHVSSDPFLQDPSRRVTQRIHSDIDPFCQTFQADSEPGWLEIWQEKDHELDQIIESQFQSPPLEAHLYRTLPSDRPLFLGNGLPVRDADHFFFPKTAHRFFCNRGLSGIDGNIATVAGLSDGLGTPLVAVIGDQAALHDLNSLSLLKNRPILLIISNNFGGGIFEHLPVAESPIFETHFAAAHHWHFEMAAKMFDLPYIRCSEPLSTWPTSGIVELITDRKKNAQFQRELIQSCSLALV